MSVGAIDELRQIQLDGRTLVVGANATLTDLERATERLAPEFGRMMSRHGSPLIRNAGTLAGNIANGSPIGDTMPALYVLNGEIELTGRAGARRVNINDFYTGYRKTCMTGDEIITRVLMPLPDEGDDFRLYKISKRHDLDISTFTAAFWMRLSGDRVVADLRIAYGGCGPNIIRLRKTEAALIGKPFNEAEIEAVTELARTEITPISDVRGSADYRLLLAENILRKYFAEVSGVETYRRTSDPGRSDLVAGLAPRTSSANGNGNGEPH
jgi:xanthine dehydrogenase small subunit